MADSGDNYTMPPGIETPMPEGFLFSPVFGLYIADGLYCIIVLHMTIILFAENIMVYLSIWRGFYSRLHYIHKDFI